MRFGVVHRFMTNALAALGVLALVASGQFSIAVSVVLLSGLALALAVRESWQRHRSFRHVDAISLLVVICTQLARLSLGASLIDILIEFAAALQVIRLATRRGAAHDQQVIVLALLHLIAGTVLGGGLGYGLCFVGVLVVAPGALVLSHLRREVEGNYRQGARDRTGLPVDVPRILRSRRVVGRTFIVATCFLSVPILLFTGVLFIGFPRVGLSLLMLNRHASERRIGFSDRIDLGAMGALQADRTVALRVEIPMLAAPPPFLAMHLRGSALDHYDGRVWSRSESFLRPAEAYHGVVPRDAVRVEVPRGQRWKVELEPMDPPVLFLPRGASGFVLNNQAIPTTRSMAFRGPEGEFRYQPSEKGLQYEVLVGGGEASEPVELNRVQRERYTKLPDNLPSRVVDLAKAWTVGASSAIEKAKAIEQRLESEYRYDNNSPSGGTKQPLDHFLFESKRGHCEYYSTAQAVLLRALDVPTRNVTGFIGGTYNRYGRFFAVRQSDAHSWVEVHVEGVGWLTFDPTPPAGSQPESVGAGALGSLLDFLDASAQRWNRHVVNYDLDQQYSLLERVASRQPLRTEPGFKKMAVAAGVLLAVTALAYSAMRYRRRAVPVKDPIVQKQRTKTASRAIALYESLESALSGHGIQRAPSVPPLRHAKNLAKSNHPLAADVVAITEFYLAARFSDCAPRDAEFSSVEAKVREIRGQRV